MHTAVIGRASPIDRNRPGVRVDDRPMFTAEPLRRRMTEISAHG
jgi:hypothetical protein